MSGHSKWSTIKRQKGASDARRGNLFTKLANTIAIAVREGGSTDPNFNFKLRLQVDKAREANMPKDNIQRAIDKGAGKAGGAILESAVYEGFGPHGVAVVVETITDNRTRTGSELRNFFDKHGGALGGPGSVSYMFTKIGEIEIGKEGHSFEEILEKSIEADATDSEEGDEAFFVYTKPDELHKVKEKLENGGLKIVSSEIVYKANKETMVAVEEANKEQLEEFLGNLEELDDVQSVYLNA